MAFGAFESALSRKGYVRPEMAELWSERTTVQCWFDVEAALARVQSRLGMVPPDAADSISAAARVTDELVELIESGRAGNPLIAGLDAMRSAVPEAARGWIHFGATSQDILDTGRALQIGGSLDEVQAQLVLLDQAVSALAAAHADTVMVVRTNGQDAVPTTLGMRFARWLAELRRAADRLSQTRERTLVSQFSGAGGTYASMGATGLDVAREVSQELGLGFELVPWHASRDAITELLTNLAIYAQTLAKIAEDLFDMQRSDIAEAVEALDPHSSGSSTMPQKRNPFATMKISVAARIAAAAAAGVLTQPPGSFERDHRQLEVERDALPRVFVAVDGAATKLLGLLQRLTFNTERLRANATREGVLVLTEGIMMEFAPRIGHQVAHDLMQEFSAEYRTNGTTLTDFVTARPELARQLQGIDLHTLQEPESYLGLSAQIARTVANSPHPV